MQAPTIKGLHGKIAVLERRMTFLESRTKDPDRRGASKDFDRAELAALKDAIACMRFVRGQEAS